MWKLWKLINEILDSYFRTNWDLVHILCWTAPLSVDLAMFRQLVVTMLDRAGVDYELLKIRDSSVWNPQETDCSDVRLC